MGSWDNKKKYKMSPDLSIKMKVWSRYHHSHVFWTCLWLEDFWTGVFNAPLNVGGTGIDANPDDSHIESGPLRSQLMYKTHYPSVWFYIALSLYIIIFNITKLLI